MDRELYKAARTGDVNLLKNVADRNAQLLNSKGPEEQTAMHIAAKLGHGKLIKEMLAVCGTHLIRELNSEKDTPLHYAARNGRLEVVDILISTASNDVERGEAKLLMMANKQGNTALHDAVIKGHDVLAIRLLQIDPSLLLLTNNLGESALHLAAKAELPSVIVEILTSEEKSLVLSKQDSGGRTALHYAARVNNTKIVDMLLKSHPSVAYILDHDGYSPLHIAVAVGSWKAVSSLLDYCPDAVEQHDLRGRTAFHISLFCRRWSERLPEKLLDVINEADNDGNTPLHLLVKRCASATIARLLRWKEVDLNIKNNEGLTPLNLAESHRRNSPAKAEEMVEALKRHGAIRGQPQQIPTIPDELPSWNVNKESEKEATATFAVGIALIATVSFAAIFTVPGGLKADGTPALAKHPAFKVFLFFNTIAMCSSIAAGICMLRERKARFWDEIWDVDIWVFYFAGYAFLAMMVTFVTAVYMVIAPESISTFIVVCFICCIPVLLDCFFIACEVTNKNPRRTFMGKIIRKLNL